MVVNSFITDYDHIAFSVTNITSNFCLGMIAIVKGSTADAARSQQPKNGRRRERNDEHPATTRRMTGLDNR
jgi:hypothetical protein